MSMTLTEFLLARIAEDEAAADQKHDSFIDDLRLLETFGECKCGYPARVLAECEAKRQIMELARDAEEASERLGSADEYSRAAAYKDAVVLLALPYADHPDYRDEWKP
jgi:hypothetical protein